MYAPAGNTGRANPIIFRLRAHASPLVSFLLQSGTRMLVPSDAVVDSQCDRRVTGGRSRSLQVAAGVELAHRSSHCVLRGGSASVQAHRHRARPADLMFALGDCCRACQWLHERFKRPACPSDHADTSHSIQSPSCRSRCSGGSRSIASAKQPCAAVLTRSFCASIGASVSSSRSICMRPGNAM